MIPPSFRMVPVLAVGTLLGLALACPGSGAAEVRGLSLGEGSLVRFAAQGEGLLRPARGQFGALTGQIDLDAADLTTARGHVQVLLGSVRTADSAWDRMFREAGFLDLDEHPRAQFALRSVRGARALPADAWTDVELEGRFTLHGVTRDVVVPARVMRSPDTDGRRSASVERVHVLSDFVIRWMDFQIHVPPPGDRELAGLGAAIHVDLRFQGR